MYYRMERVSGRERERRTMSNVFKPQALGHRGMVSHWDWKHALLWKLWKLNMFNFQSTACSYTIIYYCFLVHVYCVSICKFPVIHSLTGENKRWLFIFIPSSHSANLFFLRYVWLCVGTIVTGISRPLPGWLWGNGMTRWRGCLVRGKGKGRVKNYLKTANVALLGNQSKMDSTRG